MICICKINMIIICNIAYDDHMFKTYESHMSVKYASHMNYQIPIGGSHMKGIGHKYDAIMSFENCLLNQENMTSISWSHANLNPLLSGGHPLELEPTKYSLYP